MSHRTVTIWDHSDEGPFLVATHRSVPKCWSNKDVLKRLGIAQHLQVFEHIDGFRRCIQFGQNKQEGQTNE